MKKKAFVFFILLTSILLFGAKYKKQVPLIEKALGKYDLRVLKKIDEGKIPRYNIAIAADVEDLKDAKVDIGALLVSTLKKNGRFTVIERDKALYNEQAISATGAVSEEETIKIGKMLGGDFVLFGNVIASSKKQIDKVVHNVMEAQVTVKVTIGNAETAEVLISTEADGIAETKIFVDAQGKFVTGDLDYNTLFANAVKDAVKKIGIQLTDLFPSVGMILKKSPEKIKTDIGTANGVKDGSIIAIIRKGGANYHPVTKKLLDMDFDFLGFGLVHNAGSSTSDVPIYYLKDGVTLKSSDVCVLVDEPIKIKKK